MTYDKKYMYIYWEKWKFCTIQLNPLYNITSNTDFIKFNKCRVAAHDVSHDN